MIIHEFGYPYPKTQQLKNVCSKKGLPLLENCAWTYGSRLGKQLVGEIGDYTIYSLPKILPLQYGGLLRSFNPIDALMNSVDEEKKKIIIGSLTKYLPQIDAYNRQRILNWRYLFRLFQKIDHRPLIKIKPGTIPAAFILKTQNFQDLYRRYLDFGVETGRYYHEGALILPSHQNLRRAQLDYIFAIFNGARISKFK